MNIRPTDSAEFVALKTRMPAARSVSAVPIVDTSWADHSSRKSRFRNTENVEARGPAGTAGSGGVPSDGVGSAAAVPSVTDRSLSRHGRPARAGWWIPVDWA